MNNTQSIPVHTCQVDQETWVDLYGRKADIIMMINDKITNLNGKSLSKLIHCFLGILTKCYKFDEHTLISGDAVNKYTWSL